MLDIVGNLAIECERRAHALEKEATKQIRIVVGIVGLGLIVLLTFPWVILQFERLAANFFAETIADSTRNVAIAIRRLSDQLELRQASLELVENQRITNIENLKEFDKNVVSYFSDARSRFVQSFSVWKSGTTREGKNGSKEELFRSIISLPSGAIIAVGYTGEATKQIPAIFRARDNSSPLESVPFEHENHDMPNGVFFDVTIGKGNILVAVGQSNDALVHDDEGILLVARSDDLGRTWTQVEIGRGQAPLPGLLFTVVPDRSRFIAVGRGKSDTMMVFRSDEGGQIWKAVTLPQVEGKPPEGTLFGVAVSHKTGNELVAVGHRGRRMAIMHGNLNLETDEWTFKENQEANKKMVQGAIFRVIEARPGRFLSFGYRWTGSGLRERSVAISRIELNGAFQVENLSKLGSLDGVLFGAARGVDGTIVAVGRMGTYSLDEVLLLYRPPVSYSAGRVVEGGGKWKAVRPVDRSGSPIAGTLYGVTTDVEGRTIAVGKTVLHERIEEEFNIPTREDLEAGIDGTMALSSFVEGVGAPNLAYHQNIAPILFERGESLLNKIMEAREKQPGLAVQYDLRRNEVDVQSDTLEKVREASAALARAFTEDDIYWRVGRVAVQFTILALLIILIRVFFVRYRFLRNSAGFYLSRSHALKILAEASPDRKDELLRETSFRELVDVLSPTTMDSVQLDGPSVARVEAWIKKRLARNR